MSLITCIESFTLDDMSAELCRESFRSGKERFVVYVGAGEFEYTEGSFIQLEQAKECYVRLISDIKSGWRI